MARQAGEQPQRARSSQPAAVTQTQAPWASSVTIGACSLLHSVHLTDMTENKKSPLGGDVHSGEGPEQQRALARNTERARLPPRAHALAYEALKCGQDESAC